MQRAIEVIGKIAQRSDRVLLLHSASGKDSIALLDLIAPKFREVVCAYMYIVKDLEHINRYIAYAQGKYPNVTFVQIPHFALFGYIKVGYMGCKENPKQRKYTMAELTDQLRKKFGIEWAFIGFKQSDSLNRCQMLRTYDCQAINWKSKKCYPLSPYKNGDVLAYIERNGLIKPECYGKGQSSGTNISDIDYLLYLRENYPHDLKKIFAQFPMVERLLFEHDYETAETERDAHHQTE